MKKMLRFGMLLVLMMSLTACGADEQVYEPDANTGTPVVDDAAMDFPLFLNTGEAADIDLDGDGTAERLLVEITEDENGWGRYYMLVINGANQTDTLELYSENPDPNHYAITDLDTGDQLLEIALPYEGPSNDPSTTFLRYESGTLSSLGEVYGMVSEGHLTFDGAGVVSSFMRLSVLQTWYAPVQWRMGEKGVFEPIPQELYYPFTDSDTPAKTALKELAGYADRSLDSQRSCIDVGTQLTFLAADNICWVQCEDESGTRFWLHLDEKNSHQVELFDGSYVWDGIGGLNMAD